MSHPRIALLLAPLLLAVDVAAQTKPGKGSAKKPDPAAKAAAARLAEDERALAAFATLSEAEQRELVDYFALEASHLDTLQGALVLFVLKSQDVDAGQWPEAAPPAVFAPQVHAPGQPIPRRPLDPGSVAAREFRARVFADVPARPYESAWSYDPATRGLVRVGEPGRATRQFERALAGFLPDADLAEALVERALDDGAEMKALAAFGHAYTDREGNVYPGVTLYDAWSGGIDIEMPDVDTLGIVHTVLDDWKTWVAPVDGSQHEALYDRIGDVFTAAHRHRGLRRALAHCFLVGTQTLRDGYGPQLDNLHALWNLHESTPAKLAPKLPPAKDWEKFLADWTKRCKREGKMFQAGVRRRAELDANASAVRATLLRALEEFGAFTRLNKPREPR